MESPPQISGRKEGVSHLPKAACVNALIVYVDTFHVTISREGRAVWTRIVGESDCRDLANVRDRAIRTKSLSLN